MVAHVGVAVKVRGLAALGVDLDRIAVVRRAACKGRCGPGAVFGVW